MHNQTFTGLPQTIISRFPIVSGIGDNGTSIQWSTRTPDDRQESRVRLDRELQLSKQMEELQFQCQQNHNWSLRKLQTMPFIVVCVYQKGTRCQCVPWFLHISAAKPYGLERQIFRSYWRSCHSTGSPICYTKAPDRPNFSIPWPLRGRPQSSTPLQHPLMGLETGDKIRERRNTSWRGLTGGPLWKEWPGPN